MSAMAPPARRRSISFSLYRCSLCSCSATSGGAIAIWRSSPALWRVSSAAITGTPRNTATARGDISSRLPMGVATTYKAPAVIDTCESPTDTVPPYSALLCAAFIGARRATSYTMKRASTISRGLIWGAASLFALSACAAAPSQTTPPRAPELQARTITAAQTAADPAAQPDYLLDAAERLFRGNFIEQAKRSLRALPSTLSSQQYTRRQCLYAAIALTEHDPRAALAALKDAVRDDTPPDLRAEGLQLRAAAATQSGNVLDGVRSRAALAPLLGDAEAARRNEQALWQALISLPPAALPRLATATPADTLNGWAALALIAKTADTTAAETEQRIAAWRPRYPRHPASASVIANLAGAAPANGDRSTNIALLLPLRGPYGHAAAAVRDGFLAAYFADRLQNYKTRIRIYDSADKSAAVPQLYARALADGAELVVGPLAKEAVSALRQSGNLTVPTLALNY